MKHNSVATVLVAVGAVFGCVVVACSSDDSGTGTTIADAGVDTGTVPTNDAGADTGSPAPLVTLTPAGGNLLTCTGTVTATTSLPSQGSTFEFTTVPSNIGTSDSATWKAPQTVPSPAGFTLTATLGESNVTGTGTYTLGTAFPGTATVVSGSTGNEGESFGIYPHWTVASGNRVYAVWPDKQNNSGKVMLSRSDDGGATWLATPVAAVTTTFVDGANAHILCASVTVDPANPDVVYVLATFEGSNSLATGVGADGDALVLGVSTNGGQTFTSRVLEVGGSADGPHNIQQVGICADMVAPAANTIVVEAPTDEAAFDTPDLAIFSDTNQGAGFATGTLAGDDYIADGFIDSLANVNNAPDENHRLDIGQNGAGSENGGATESPRLSTDGKGNICLTFVATQNAVTPNVTSSYIMCSKNNGSTWSSLLALDAAGDGQLPHAHAIAAMGPNNKVAVVWTNGADPGAALEIATSTDGGATFATPAKIPIYPIKAITGSPPALTPSLAYDANGILWLAYAPYDGNTNDRIVVDKSCSDGATWSGPVLVNGPEGHIPNLQWPSLAMTTGAPHVFVMAQNHMTGFSLAP